jgi:hypothetical protein
MIVEMPRSGWLRHSSRAAALSGVALALALVHQLAGAASAQPRERTRARCGAAGAETSEPANGAARARNELEQKPLRVLMIGNSYTRFNLLHKMLQRVAEASGRRVHVDIEARGGYSLRQHLKHGTALARIRNGRYTHVVLQGHSMSAVDHPDQLAEDAQRFHAAITAAGAQTVLYQTWARRPNASIYRNHHQLRSFADMALLVDTTYSGIARRLGAELAPVGGAFQQALQHDPSVPLWGSDGSHPTLAGSYMAACVLYGAITGTDPRQTSYVPWTLDSSLANKLRTVAATSLLFPGDLPFSGKPPLVAPSAPSSPSVVGNVAASIAALMGPPPGADPVPSASDTGESSSSRLPAAPTSAAPQLKGGSATTLDGASPSATYGGFSPTPGSFTGVGSI